MLKRRLAHSVAVVIAILDGRTSTLVWVWCKLQKFTHKYVHKPYDITME